MFTVGRIVTSNIIVVCEVLLDGQLWGNVFGKTREEAQRRAEMAVRALNRDRRVN
jgi:hypothetical protein